MVYKDWQPLVPSSRMKMQHILPDTYILVINDVITKDEGLYSVAARNPAGAVSSSAMIHVEDNEDEFAYRTYHRGRQVKARTVEANRIFGDYYDLGDELGRGTQGVTYHSVERSTGRSLAAKIMTGTGPELRSRMTSELDMMNQLSHRRLVRKETLPITSARCCRDSDTCTAHLGLTPGDLFLTHPDGDELKIGDFGLARRIYANKLASLDYGMPEFVAPETANGQGVGLAADLWSVGVITYLFLSGISPFRGHRYGSRHFAPRPDRPDQLNSNEAKDFLAKLLVFCADDRLTVEQVIDDFIDIYLNFVLIDFANIVGAGSSVAETGGSHCPRPLPDPNRAAEDLLRATQWRLSHLVQTPSAQRRFYSSVLHGVPARRRVHSEAVARTPPVHQKRGDCNYKIIIGNR